MNESRGSEGWTRSTTLLAGMDAVGMAEAEALEVGWCVKLTLV